MTDNVYQLYSYQPLQSGDGGGTSDGMEARVAVLEKRMDRVETKLDTLLEKTGKLEGEVSRLPGYPGLFVMCGVLIGIVTLVIRFVPAV